MYNNTIIGANATKMIQDATHQTTNFIISSWMSLEFFCSYNTDHNLEINEVSFHLSHNIQKLHL